MRILHVNKFLYRRGGAEAYMFDLAALQRGAGEEVAFFGMDHPDNEAMPFTSHYPSYVEFRGGSVRERLKASARMLYSTSAATGIEAVLRVHRPDVVHLHNIYHQLSPSIIQPMARHDIATVMTLHDYKLACPSYQFLDHGKVCEACLGGRFFHAATHRCKDGSLGASILVTIEAYVHSLTSAYSGVNLFIAPSRFLAGKMMQARVFPDRIRQVSHFVDTVSMGPRTEPGAGFVYAGRLSPEKGVDVLIRALEQQPDLTAVVLGDGPERSRLEQLARRVAPGRVSFRGRVDKEAVKQVMRSARAVVVPSRWYENQPMTVLEAMACGVPVVGTTLGGIPEIVSEGVTGFTVPANDPPSLALKLRLLADHPSEALEMGHAAQIHVATHYSPALHLQRIGDVYAEAMDAPTRVLA